MNLYISILFVLFVIVIAFYISAKLDGNDMFLELEKLKKEYEVVRTEHSKLLTIYKQLFNNHQRVCKTLKIRSDAVESLQDGIKLMKEEIDLLRNKLNFDNAKEIKFDQAFEVIHSFSEFIPLVVFENGKAESSQFLRYTFMGQFDILSEEYLIIRTTTHYQTCEIVKRCEYEHCYDTYHYLLNNRNTNNLDVINLADIKQLSLPMSEDENKITINKQHNGKEYTKERRYNT